MMSPLEIACRRWIANGKTVDDIARLEGRVRDEIEAQITRAIAKLEAEYIEAPHSGQTQTAIDSG